jgi:hypothetical protein
MLYDGTKDGERREVAIGYFHRYIQINRGFCAFGRWFGGLRHHSFRLGEDDPFGFGTNGR